VIGHELMVRRPEGFVDAARAHFERAIEIDPGFAAPYAERAMQLVLISGATDDNAEYAAARQDIDRALALDPNEAVAHAALGLYEWYRPHRDDPLADDVAAEASFRRALELDPYLVSVWNWLARALQAQGRHDEADEAFSNAARIDPLAATIGSNLARSEASRGLFEEAEARLLRLSEAPQPSEVVVFTLIDLYIDSGRFQPALETLRHCTLQSATNRSQLIGMSYLGRLSADLGDTQGAEAWQARALAEAEDPDELRLHWIGENIGTPIYEYAKSAGEFRQALKALGRELGEVEPYMQLQYGALLSLAGEFTEAGEILAPLLMPGGLFEFDELVHDVNVRHSLYWAWLHSGDPDRAVTELRMLEAYFQQKLDNGRMHRSDDLIDYARNQLLLGDTERALDLLERAELAGWRGYFHLLHDPRWNAIRDNSRFRAVMARTREDIHAQRARIEEAMPEAEFVAKLDAAMRLRKELNSGRD
jgi:tetratricopeptide (TPR) repeat protein